MGKSWDQFWHFDEAAYAQDVAKLSPQQLTELHGTVRRKVISTTTGAGFGVVSASATGGLSLVASGVSGRQRTVNSRRLKIIEARMTEVDAERYKTTKRDYLIPIGVGTAGIGIATGLEDTFADQLGSDEAVYAAKAATEVGVEHAYEAVHKHTTSTPETIKANGTIINPTSADLAVVQASVPLAPGIVPSAQIPNGPVLSGLMPSSSCPGPVTPSRSPFIVPSDTHFPAPPGSTSHVQPPNLHPQFPNQFPPPPQLSQPVKQNFQPPHSCSSVQPIVPVATKPSLISHQRRPSHGLPSKQSTGDSSSLLEPPPPPQPPRPISSPLVDVPQAQVPELPSGHSSSLVNKIPPPPPPPPPSSAPLPASIPPPPPPKIPFDVAGFENEKIPVTKADDSLMDKLVGDIESYLTLHTDGPPPSYTTTISDSDKIIVVDTADDIDYGKKGVGDETPVDFEKHSKGSNGFVQAPRPYNPATFVPSDERVDEKSKIKAYNPAEYQPLGKPVDTIVPPLPTYNPAAWG